jgi:hypothetical protein
MKNLRSMATGKERKTTRCAEHALTVLSHKNIHATLPNNPAVQILERKNIVSLQTNYHTLKSSSQ